MALGFPSPTPTVRRPQPGCEKRPVRVLHAPTRPLHKGTAQITAAIEQLRLEGLDIDFETLSGRSNAEVLDRLRSSDLVIDQVYGDVLLGGLGVEAAAAGCDVALSGYATPVLTQNHRCPLPPIDTSPPEDLVGSLRRILRDSEQLRADGARLQAFVAEHWNPTAVAARYLAVANGHPDPAWMVDPLNSIYCEGWGMARDELSGNLRTYLLRFGSGGLHLSHHADLVDALTDFACPASHGMPAASDVQRIPKTYGPPE